MDIDVVRPEQWLIVSKAADKSNNVNLILIHACCQGLTVEEGGVKVGLLIYGGYNYMLVY